MTSVPAKISTSMMPSQKSGTLMPKMTKPSVSRRIQRPPVAARTPSGTPTSTASSMARAVSSKVTGRRCARSCGERGVADDVLAEIAAKDAAGPADVLVEEALIETELLAQLGDVFVGRPEAQHGSYRIARHEPDDQEHEDAHHEQHRDGEQEASRDERQLAHWRGSSCSARSTNWRMRFSDRAKWVAAIAAASSPRPSVTAATRSVCWKMAMRRASSL